MVPIDMGVVNRPPLDCARISPVRRKPVRDNRAEGNARTTDGGKEEWDGQQGPALREVGEGLCHVPSAGCACGLN
ncbi:hypothetical protein FKM82_022201 [Ascaphus truei]